MTRDYLGKATLVASSASPSAAPSRAPSRANSTHRSPGILFDARPLPDIPTMKRNPPTRPGFRSRQHSEPPLNRREFSTTSLEYHAPILERLLDRPSTEATNIFKRSESVGRRPNHLNLGAAAFDRNIARTDSRVGATRSESERPAARRAFRESIASDASSLHNSKSNQVFQS